MQQHCATNRPIFKTPMRSNHTSTAPASRQKRERNDFQKYLTLLSFFFFRNSNRRIFETIYITQIRFSPAPVTREVLDRPCMYHTFAPVTRDITLVLGDFQDRFNRFLVSFVIYFRENI